MVATVENPNSSRYLATNDPALSGVVRVSDGVSTLTGSLLFGGRYVLTAAHGVVNSSLSNLRVTYIDGTGFSTLTAKSVTIHPFYRPTSSNTVDVPIYDLALVELSQPAPSKLLRYQLSRDGLDIGKTGVVTGYGRPMDGVGNTYSETRFELRKALNVIDAFTHQLPLKSSGAATAIPFGAQLLIDFDNGTAARDAAGRELGLSQLGFGPDEGNITSGDSGGPLLLRNPAGAFEIAGSASYALSFTTNQTPSDIDTRVNGSFGEFASYERAVFHQQFIDTVLQASLPNKPLTREEVKKEIVEGNSGIQYAYFMLDVPNAVEGAAVSVAYKTFDVSATAGVDYIAQAGRVLIYPGQKNTVIAVEILGDTVAEANEQFGLEISDPIGGNFGDQMVLRAFRTILDDDSGAVQLVGVASAPDAG